MNKKKIVLADNSYTIRRIVELSFSEEAEIELISFEDGVGLKEKLLEMRPAIVLVDIKLPGFNGYEVCRFINTTEAIKHTRVFLLKGGFEPIDESILTNLSYASIITKPFDSNALVATIKKMLISPAAAAKPQRAPSSVPEATPAPGYGFTPPAAPRAAGMPGAAAKKAWPGDMNLDMKDDYEADSFLGEMNRPSQHYQTVDDVLPSEEITQGTPEIDNLAPTQSDDFDNPFGDDNALLEQARKPTLPEEEFEMMQHIRNQESELEIGSVTMEEMQIQQRIAKAQGGLPRNSQMTFDDNEIDPDAMPSPGMETAADGKQFGGQDLDMDMDLDMDLDMDMGGDFDAGSPGEASPALEIEHNMFQQPPVKQARAPQVPPAASAPPAPKAPFGQAMGAKTGLAHNLDNDLDFGGDMQNDEMDLDFGAQPSKPAPRTAAPAFPSRQAPAGMQGIGQHAAAAAKAPAAPVAAFGEVEYESDISLEPPRTQKQPPAAAKVPPQQPKAEATPVEKIGTGTAYVTGKEQLMAQLETNEQISNAVKEILWDIVPDMAERIIKTEIEKIKSEVERSIDVSP